MTDTPEYRKRFGMLLEELAASVGHFPSPALIRGVWKDLQRAGVTDDEYEAAIRQAQATWEKWFSGATLRALCLSERARKHRLLHPTDYLEPSDDQPTPEWEALKSQLKMGEIVREIPADQTPIQKVEALKKLRDLA